MIKAKEFLKKHLGDLIVGIGLLAITFSLLTYYLIPRNTDGKIFANVYHQNTIIYEKIDLSGEDKEYPINIKDGDLDIEMVVELKDHKIGIHSSNCSNQYCVHQGFTDSIMQTLICAPNEVMVTLYSENKTIDSEIIV